MTDKDRIKKCIDEGPFPGSRTLSVTDAEYLLKAERRAMVRMVEKFRRIGIVGLKHECPRCYVMACTDIRKALAERGKK